MVLHDHDLCLKPEKCFFEEPKVQYLGLIVGNGQVRTDPEKIATLKQWKVPTTKKALQSFLGSINFYHDFIHDFSKIAKPLHNLTGNKPWTWGPEQQTAFKHLKESLCAQPMLRIPIDDVPFRVETNCSQYALGSVCQRQSVN